MKPSNKLTPTVDARIELMAVIQHLSRTFCHSENLIPASSTYRKALTDHFRSAENLEAVTLYDDICHEQPDLWNPLILMLCMNDRIERTGDQLPEELKWSELELHPGVDETRWVKSLQEFNNVSNFSSFFESQQDYYESKLNETYSRMKGYDYILQIENYFGSSYDHYRLIVSPLYIGGLGPRLIRPDGKKEAVVIIGLHHIESSLLENQSLQQQYIIWHEYSHSFVNPLGIHHFDEINKYAYLYQKLAGHPIQNYNSWSIYFNELIVEAITCRLTFRYYGGKKYTDVMNYFKKAGYLYMEYILNALEAYEHSGMSFAQYFPKLIKVFAGNV